MTPNHLPFVVEPMTLADLDDVMQIERVAFSAPWSARAYRYEITGNEYSIMLVVRPRSRSESWLPKLLHRLSFTGQSPVLGYGGAWLMIDELHIATLAVHPRWRGLGLGELLLLSFLDQGAENGARQATLEVRVTNEVALGLYRKYGFEITARRKGYYTDNNEDAYIMVTPPFNTLDFQASLNRHRIQLFARLSSEQTRKASERPPA